jgi:hypothetical protein
LAHLSASARPLEVATVHATFHTVHTALTRGFATVNTTLDTGVPSRITPSIATV